MKHHIKKFSKKRIFKILSDKSWLEGKYIKDDMNYPMIAKIVGCANSTIQKWINKHNIPKKPMGAALKGNKNGRWKGGTYKTRHGYIMVRNDSSHPRARISSRYTSYVPQHTLVMEKHIGRFLTREEVVHHRNGIRNDNRIENLQLLPNNGKHTNLEQTICLFAKQVMWGELIPELKEKLQKIFSQFVRK